MARKIILDLDTGIDDALALAYALGSPGLELLAVTGTYGNVTVEQGVANTLSLLDLLARPDIPVYAGPGHASDRQGFEVLEISRFIHGGNGIGNVDVARSGRGVQAGSAVDFLIGAVESHGDDLVIVSTGPSTTVAQAMKQSEDFAHNAHIVFMGGALTVPGNVTPWSEANVHQDPLASDYMLRQSRDISMVGLDVTLQTLLTTEHTATWRGLGTDAGRTYADMLDYYIDAYAVTAPYLGGCGLHDPLAVAAAEDDSIITWLPHAMKVDVEGSTRGRTIGDETQMGPSRRSRVAVGVDAERFVARLMERMATTLA